MAIFRGACGPKQHLYVEIELRPADGQLAGPGARASVRGLAILDTGAQVSLISTFAIQDLGLISQADGRLIGVTGIAETRSAYDLVVDLIGNFSNDPPRLIGDCVEMLEDPRSHAATFGGMEIALLGMDVMAGHLLSLNGAGEFVFECLPVRSVP